MNHFLQLLYFRQSIGSQIKLIHVNTGQALKFSGKVYPEWGFYQNEIVCDKQHNQLDTIWNVEEHRYTKSELLFWHEWNPSINRSFLLKQFI